MRADRDTAGGHEQVVLEPPSDSLAMGFVGVGDRRQALSASARRSELRREDQPVGLVDLTGPEGLAGAAKLGSRGENGGPRSRSTRDFGHTGRGERSELGGAKPCSGRHDALAGANVSAARTNIRTRSNGLGNLDDVAMFDNILDGDDGIGSFGKRAPGRDPHRLAGVKRFSAAGPPAGMRSTTGSVPGVSAARRANPSIAEFANGGRSTSAVAGSASTRPAADSSRTRSAGSGRTRSRIRRCASSIVRSSATIAAYRTRGG